MKSRILALVVIIGVFAAVGSARAVFQWQGVKFKAFQELFLPSPSKQAVSQVEFETVDVNTVDTGSDGQYVGEGRQVVEARGNYCEKFPGACPGTVNYCLDNDKDGFGGASCFAMSDFGEMGSLGFSKAANSDCDDNNPARNPGAFEACDGIDNNCDGGVDNNDNTIMCGSGKSCVGGACIVPGCDLDGKRFNNGEVVTAYDTNNIVGYYDWCSNNHSTSVRCNNGNWEGDVNKFRYTSCVDECVPNRDASCQGPECMSFGARIQCNGQCLGFNTTGSCNNNISTCIIGYCARSFGWEDVSTEKTFSGPPGGYSTYKLIQKCIGYSQGGSLQVAIGFCGDINAGVPANTAMVSETSCPVGSEKCRNIIYQSQNTIPPYTETSTEDVYIDGKQVMNCNVKLKITSCICSQHPRIAYYGKGNTGPATRCYTESDNTCIFTYGGDPRYNPPSISDTMTIRCE